MASISKLPNKRKAIQIQCPDGRRRSIRLGQIDMPGANSIKSHVEAIASRRWRGLEPIGAQVEWLNTLATKMPEVYDRLAKVGIVDERTDAVVASPTPRLGKFIQDYINGRTDLKPSTKEQYGYTRRLLVEHFGEHKHLADITRADAKAWQRWMRSYEWKKKTESSPAKTMAEATVSKHTKRAKTLFTEAVDARLIDANPMDAIKGTGEVNRDRDFFVDASMASTILESIPDYLYRLAFALARYGGFRACEILSVTWSDMLWDENKVRNNSPKTGLRFVPMFGELRPYLDEAHERAPDGQVRCLAKFARNTNLGVQLMRYVESAGVQPWRKPLQNLRASRRTELEERYPNHVVNSWMGHSSKVAQESYLQVTPEHWDTATGPVPTSATSTRLGSSEPNCKAEAV